MKQTITKAQYPAFFAALRAACKHLGYITKEQHDELYRTVCQKYAKCDSIKKIKTQEQYEACINAFKAAAFEYTSMEDPEVEEQKRRAYVVKVLCCQICQIQGIHELAARMYLEGVLNHTRAGIHTSGEEFYLDLSCGTLLLAINILSTHLRKLQKEHYPTFNRGFNDRVKFIREPHSEGDVFTFEDVGKYYYANLPFLAKN